jgi:hypothetical protein
MGMIVTVKPKHAWELKMSYSFDDLNDPRNPASTGSDLPLEAQFEGARRTSPAKDDLFDPRRYWEIFSGTD